MSAVTLQSGDRSQTTGIRPPACATVLCVRTGCGRGSTYCEMLQLVARVVQFNNFVNCLLNISFADRCSSGSIRSRMRLEFGVSFSICIQTTCIILNEATLHYSVIV